MVVWGENFNGLDCEGLGGVLAEHGYEDVVDYFSFRYVGCGYVYEDVAGLEGDLRMV